MVNEKDQFKRGMSPEEYNDALNDFVEAFEEAGEQIPICARMQMDEEEITPPDPELTKALEEIDKEFGVKVEKNS